MTSNVITQQTKGKNHPSVGQLRLCGSRDMASKKRELSGEDVPEPRRSKRLMERKI
jgi:hypothetical protein